MAGCARPSHQFQIHFKEHKPMSSKPNRSILIKLMVVWLVLLAAFTVSAVNAPLAQGAAATIDSEFLTTLPAAHGPITTSGKGYRFDSDGWIYVHIEGDPHERGYQHGFLVAKELDAI